MVGVNGAGKTTFIGKLADSARTRREEASWSRRATPIAPARSTSFACGPTRAGAQFVGSTAGADPASVAFSAIDAAIARNIDVVIIDTAGRLHTQDGLMTELQKVGKVIAKRIPGAPHETLLVLDGTIGQNAVAQARAFSAAVPLTGLVITKLDGTARGGIVVAVHEALDVPVKFVGVGEQADDLESFDPATFAAELLETE